MSDILIGLVPALGWGVQGIVMQKVGGRTANKQMGMVLTTFVVAVAVLIIRPPSANAWTASLILAALLNGIPWALGQILQIRSFELMGVSRAMPISTGTQLLGTTLVGVLFFHEWKNGWQFGVGLPALLLLVIGVWMTTFREKGAETGEIDNASNIKKGFSILLLSSLAFVFYATAGLIFKVDALDLLFPQAVVMVITTIIIAYMQSKKGEATDREVGVFGKKSWANMLTGICFAAANLTMLISVQRNGAAVGWTLSQMNVIVATLGGLLILEERKTKKELIYVLSGLALVAIGGVLIGVTKN
ncbi:GRP family sugar transporter [Rarobacter incanus]|uniref:Glucose uptake protein n=1 Tax=Rarobacter incanus TaxID=153494 RepID=A0A542SPA1_9MICO|nr:GRP family sugar transporter [Rarobacter incanus]TQK76449.1 glucose uptake protein [Rarobacter incanus]